MPGVAHLFIAIMVGIFLVQVSDRKFTPYHAFVWIFNNEFGPDIAWLIPNLAVANFFNSCFGFMCMALVWAIPFLFIGKKLDVPMNYWDSYRLVVAGGFAHIGIDGLGHIRLTGIGTELDDFWLFSFDAKAFCLGTPAGIILFIGGLVGISMLVFIRIYKMQTVERVDHEPQAAESNVLLASARTTLVLIAPVMVPLLAIIMLWFMPFGDGMWFTLGEAVYTTGIWSGVGENYSIAWIVISAAIVSVLFLALYKKYLKWSVILMGVYAIVLFLAVWIEPGLGAGESELGPMYFLLVFVGVPLFLLGTSFHKKSQD